MGLAKMRRYYHRRSAAKTAVLAPAIRNNRDIPDTFMRFSNLAIHSSKCKSNVGGESGLQARTAADAAY
jgi:hypothetical protein